MTETAKVTPNPVIRTIKDMWALPQFAPLATKPKKFQDTEFGKLTPGSEEFLYGYKADKKDGKIDGDDLFIKYQPSIDMRKALDKVYPGYEQDMKDGKADGNDILDNFMKAKGIKDRKQIPDIEKIEKQLEAFGQKRQKQVFTFIGEPKKPKINK